MRIRSLAAALAAAAPLTLALPAGAVTPAPDPETAADWAAGWVARQVNPDGSVDAGFSGPVGNAVSAGLALAAGGAGADAFDRAVAYVATNVEAFVADEGGDRPGALAQAILLADAAGLDPAAFGPDESDLVLRLEATETEDGPDEGHYGPGTPFDSVFNHAFGLLALHAAGAAPSDAALDWLLGQQCDDGGWPAYRPPGERAPAPCLPATTRDTNSTALALQALAALTEDPVHDPVPFLADRQNEDGGFGYAPPFDATDANSTGLVVQALVALGEDLDDWAVDGATPVDALLALQIGCDAHGTQRGAFVFQPPGEGEEHEANAFATYQATLGVAKAPFPLGERTLTADEPFPPCPLVVTRSHGEDRIETAAILARSGYPDGVDTVVITRAFDYADALAGAPLAVAEDAPLLLSRSDALPDAVEDTINDLGATRAILLGGPEALSPEIEQQLLERTTVQTVDRIEGEDRFETAALIADRFDDGTVYVTEGIHADPFRGWPDALAVSGLAAFEARPILLVRHGELPDTTREALAGRDAAVVVGGEAAVSAAVFAELESLLDDVTRVAGEDRYETAYEVTLLARDAGMDPMTSWFATGRTFADALAAGPRAGTTGTVLMLVDGLDIEGSPATVAYVEEVAFALDDIQVVGGPEAIDPDVVAALIDHAR